MARRCAVTNKGVMAGNNVSHANNRTRRRFLPNLQQASFMSEALEETVKLRLTTHGIRTVEHRGGIDAYLLSTPATALPKDLRALRKRIEQARAAG